MSRDEYAEKFKKQFGKVAYVLQEGEEIVQCSAPYPEYWFASNKGYVFTASRSEFKVLKQHYRRTGKKNKDGERPGQDWYYEYKVKGEKNNRHVPVHKIISDTFLTNAFDSKDDEIHHKRKRSVFKPNEGKLCNRADNLQVLPRSVHKELTKYANKTMNELNEETEKKIEESGCPVFNLTEDQQEQFRIWAINFMRNYIVQGGEPILLKTSISDNVADIEAEAYPVGKVEIIHK